MAEQKGNKKRPKPRPTPEPTPAEPPADDPVRRHEELSEGPMVPKKAAEQRLKALKRMGEMPTADEPKEDG